MLLFLFSACLNENLIGDSDHPLDPNMGDFEAESIQDLDPGEPPESARVLMVESSGDSIFVEHKNIDLHCSPELFDNEIRLEGETIIVEYMLGDEPRACVYDLRYQIEFTSESGATALEPGAYILKADGDIAEFQIE